jgi:hypothetical protein
MGVGSEIAMLVDDIVSDISVSLYMREEEFEKIRLDKEL